MDVKIRHKSNRKAMTRNWSNQKANPALKAYKLYKLIEIEDHVSDRFVILITNDRWLRILEVIKYR